MPGSLEAYYQEAGRAGRDGEPARCVLFFNAADRRTHRYFIAARFRAVKTRLARSGLESAALDAELQEHDERRQRELEKLEQMVLYGQHPTCRWRYLLEYFREPVEPGFECGHCDVCAGAQL